MTDIELGPDVVYAVGSFGNLGGEPRGRVGAVALDDGSATGWDPDPDGDVTAIQLVGDRLFVGGEFETIGGRPRRYLAELDVADAAATRWDPAPNEAVSVFAVPPSARELVVGGAFDRIDGARRELASFDLATTTLTSWRPEAPFEPAAASFGTDGSTLYLGGADTFLVFR